MTERCGSRDEAGAAASAQPPPAPAAAIADDGADRPPVSEQARAEPARPPSPVLDLGIAVALASALIYTAGWAYAYRWFARFDLGIAGLDLPGETFLIYGFWTLRLYWYVLALYAFGLVLWLRHGAEVHRWIVRTAPFWLLLAFAGAYLAGIQQANRLFERHQADGFRCFPSARVGLTPENDRRAPFKALAEGLAEHEYRLLLQTSNLLVLIKPKPQGPPVTALVPLGRVEAVRLLSTMPDCVP